MYSERSIKPIIKRDAHNHPFKHKTNAVRKTLRKKATNGGNKVFKHTNGYKLNCFSTTGDSTGVLFEQRRWRVGPTHNESATQAEM